MPVIFGTYKRSILKGTTRLILFGMLATTVVQIVGIWRTRIGVGSSYTTFSITSIAPFNFCKSTRRCEPIRQNGDLISYVHISKNAGSSWIQELKRIKNISVDFNGGPESFGKVGLYPTKHGDNEHSVKYQEQLLQQFYSGPFQRFLTLRSPRHHVWSLFSQCYFSQWGILETYQTGFPRNHPEDVILDFRRWLDHFATETSLRRTQDAFHCYHPANYQSRALSVLAANPHNVVDSVYEPNKTIVNETYWAMDWVSLTSFFHESKCVLYHRMSKADSQSHQMLQDYLEQTCHCHVSPAHRSLTSTQWLGDIKDTHYVPKNRPVLAELPSDVLQKIDLLTYVDQFLYKIALKQFVHEVVWVESEIHRRILCNPVLDIWEDKLAYLGFSLKKIYFENQQK